MRLWPCREDRLRCFQSVGEGGLDGSHIRAGIKRLAGKEYGAAIRLFRLTAPPAFWAWHRNRRRARTGRCPSRSRAMRRDPV